MVCAKGLFFIGDPGDKSVGIYLRKASGTSWFAASLIKFGSLGKQMTSDGADFGGALSVSSDHILAVGAPGSTPTLDHSDSPVGNTGSVFIYRLIAVSHGATPEVSVQLVTGINPPIDYAQPPHQNWGSTLRLKPIYI